MKKAITILLTTVLMLSMVACGGNGNQPNNKPISDNEEPIMQGNTSTTAMSKEEMIEIAKELKYLDYNTDVTENSLRAKETYVGNTYKIFGFVQEITEEYCVLGFGNYKIKVNLPKDVLLALNKDEGINIVGIIDNIDTNIIIETAYYIDNISERTFEIQTFIQSNGEMESCIGGNCRVFLDKDTLASLTQGETITVKGNVYTLNEVETVASGIQFSAEIRNATLVNQ